MKGVKGAVLLVAISGAAYLFGSLILGGPEPQPVHVHTVATPTQSSDEQIALKTAERIPVAALQEKTSARPRPNAVATPCSDCPTSKGSTKEDRNISRCIRHLREVDPKVITDALRSDPELARETAQAMESYLPTISKHWDEMQSLTQKIGMARFKAGNYQIYGSGLAPKPDPRALWMRQTRQNKKTNKEEVWLVEIMPGQSPDVDREKSQHDAARAGLTAVLSQMFAQHKRRSK